MSDQLRYVSSAGESGFGRATPNDEYLHGTGPAGDSLTETWYWGFFVPEHRINCYAYCWVHPNLHVASCGLMIYQGVKAHHLEAELFDMPMFLSDGVVGEGGHIRVPGGMQVRVVTPLEDIRLEYADPARETAVDVRIEAVSKPVVRPNNKHFEQVVRVTGELTLRGEHHAVDCITVRDRSWGELRPEGHNPSPPLSWITGAAADGSVAFTVNALDHGVDDAFKDGWIWRDGNAVRLVDVQKTTEREPGTLRPTRHLVDGVDAQGRTGRMVGDVVAGLPWGGWHNARCHLGLVRWQLDGATAFGETIDVQWNDYIWRNSANR